MKLLKLLQECGLRIPMALFKFLDISQPLDVCPRKKEKKKSATGILSLILFLVTVTEALSR